MKLVDVIIFTLSIGFTLIGIHQTMVVGLAYSYWIFMLSISLLLLYRLRKKNTQSTKNEDSKKAN